MIEFDPRQDKHFVGPINFSMQAAELVADSKNSTCSDWVAFLRGWTSDPLFKKRGLPKASERSCLPRCRNYLHILDPQDMATPPVHQIVSKKRHSPISPTSELMDEPLSLARSLRIVRCKTKEIAATDSLWHAGLFFVKAVRDPHSVGLWLIFLSTFERTHGLGQAGFDTIAKPLGNYAVYKLSTTRRVEMLRSHYQRFAMTVPPAVLSILWTGGSMDLGYLEGKCGQKYRLTLGPARHCHKEGEFSFTLADQEDGLELARLTFLLMTLGTRDETSLLIGGLQGPHPAASCANAKTRIVSATRALSGLRPKMAVFAAVSIFASATGTQSLRAVSNRTHTINADAYYQRRRMHADYDAFWRERGGTYDLLGFSIPLDITPTSKKPCRNEHRARIATLVNRLFQQENDRQI